MGLSEDLAIGAGGITLAAPRGISPDSPEVRIHITDEPLGALSPLFRPSAFATHADDAGLAVDCSSNAAALGVGVVATTNGRAVVHRWDPHGPADIDVQVRRGAERSTQRLGRFAVEVFA